MATQEEHILEEQVRRQHRKDAYHLAAGNNKLPADADDTDFLFRFLTEPSAILCSTSTMIQAKTALVEELARSGGSADTPRFCQALDQLTKEYDPSHFDARNRRNKQLGGMWLTLTKPKYPDCLGRNPRQEYMYTLGRMSFDMFRPSNLVCSIQGSFNPIHYVSRRDAQAIERVPKSLREEIKQGNSVLRTYNVVTACSIEPSSNAPSDGPNGIIREPIKALMTTYGYALPDPSKPNRLSIWFTGGSIEVNDDVDREQWIRIFSNLPQRPVREQARVFSARLVLRAAPPKGMEEDGKMSYTLNRPVGGHGVAFVDVLYLDETLRIVRGSAGDVVVFARVPHFPDE